MRSVVSHLRAGRGGVVLLACVVALPAVVYLYSARLPTIYQAGAVVEQQAPASASRSDTVAAEVLRAGPGLVAFWASRGFAAVETGEILDRPVSALGSLGATFDAETGWITLTATGADPEQTARTANALAQAMERLLRERRTELQQRLLRLTTQRLRRERDPEERQRLAESIRVIRSFGGSEPALRVVDVAEGGEPVSPNPARNATLALLVGILAAPALLLVVRRLDPRVRRAAELETLTGADVLVTVPEGGDRPGRVLAQPDESLRTLRDRLVHSQARPSLSVLAIVSPLDAEPNTTVAIGLAAAFADTGRHVVLVDADLRAGRLARALELPAGPGLAEVLEGRDLASVIREIPGPSGRLMFVAAGTAGRPAADLLGGGRTGPVLGGLARAFDVVIVDTSPLLLASDALPLISHATGVLEVVRLGQTPRGAVRRASEIVASAGGALLGVVGTTTAPRQKPAGPAVTWASTYALDAGA